MSTPLVRGGGDTILRAHGDDPGHKLRRVYGEMLLQVCRDYPGLPDPRTLSLSEIRFYYEGLRAELREHTKPKPQAAPSRSYGARPRKARR